MENKRKDEAYNFTYNFYFLKVEDKEARVVKRLYIGFMNGGPNKIRTCDHYLVEVVLYQLSYETITVRAKL